MIGIVDIDIHRSTDTLRGNKDEAKTTFEAWHEFVDGVLGPHGAKLWSRAGDEIIYTFGRIESAVEGCIGLLEAMGKFNADVIPRLGSPVYIRIGLVGSEDETIPEIQAEARGKTAAADLSRAGHLQKQCPVGSLTIGNEVYRAIGVRRSMFRPSSTEPLRDVGAYICSSRQASPYADRLLEGLTDSQKAVIPPFFALDWAQLVPESGMGLMDLLTVLSGPVLVVLGETNRDPDSTITRAATSDIVGVAELLASMRANRDVVVSVDQWEDTADLANSHNIVVIGSGLANAYASAINDLIRPVRFDKHGGQVFDRIIATGHHPDDGEGQWAFAEHGEVGRNCGLVVLCRSPFSRQHHLLWIAGISGIDTQAGSQFVSDMVADPKGTMRRTGVPDGFSPIACVIGSRGRKRSGLAAKEYYRRWRIRDYDVAWAADAGGRCVEPRPS